MHLAIYAYLMNTQNRQYSEAGNRREPYYYTYQLRAFVAAVRGEQPVATAGSDGILNMWIEQYSAGSIAKRTSVNSPTGAMP
jgi:hypothetical protein